ncbi:hypothetical protein BDN72DRAFT_962733 [Pluteus cervinus]|uniref:Uncharacterized protein n=1 Tax=Pluteus cervinus TaxID=181527 RepID=A0ACD3AHF6_9AGAR|nr:hypothetical protein BDN72DRAFT_962733 [Pluteus cervinus]
MSWKALVVRRTLEKTRYELAMLLIQGPGPVTSFSPRINRSRATFASFEIHLPSVYSGGQVHASYCNNSKAFDFSIESLHTNLFASYAEVVSSTEISSGYRIALCYNLIHTGSAHTIPAIVSSNEPLSRIRSALSTWKHGQYRDDLDSFALVHYLPNSDPEQFEEGLKTLDRDDQSLITNLHRVAEDLGYRVFLGLFECDRYGRAEHGIYKCYDDNCPDLVYVEGTNRSIKSLVDLEGSPVLDYLNIGEACFLQPPQDYFADKEPDSRSFDDTICVHS